MEYTHPQAALLIDFADLGVTTGYIGNIERWGDDRGFYVFTKLSTEYGATSCNCSIFIGDAKTLPKDDNGHPIVEYDTPAVRARLEALGQKLVDSKIYRVRADRWLEKAKADAAAGKVPAYHTY